MSMQKLEKKHIRLMSFLNGWIWQIIHRAMTWWQWVSAPAQLGRLTRTYAGSGDDGTWQLSLKEGVNNITGWL